MTIVEPEAGYETGKWYGWNGGECPVHPETVVYAVSEWGILASSSGACDVNWAAVVAFRIIAPYVPITYATEPAPKLECWMNVYSNGGREYFPDESSADNFAHNNRIRCVRMVEADEQYSTASSGKWRKS